MNNKTLEKSIKIKLLEHLLSIKDPKIDRLRAPKRVGIVELEQVNAPPGVDVAAAVYHTAAVMAMYWDDLIHLFIVVRLFQVAFVDIYQNALRYIKK